jgi:phosphoribosylamine--glycine ligase
VRVLLVGAGGREHALAWKLSESTMLGELHAAPGNPGIARLAECHPVAADDVAGVVQLARHLSADLVVVGPEMPLVAGLANALGEADIPVFGPTRGAARVEGSKRFAKGVMREAGVATAEMLPMPRPPCVVKVDGLAAGKGVFVCRSDEELDRALARVAELDGALLVEELLDGDELSLFALTDGRDAVALPPARDFKPACDGDTGPNTGGMGSYSPVPAIGGDDVEELVNAIHLPTLRELERRGIPFAGLLYAGLMLTHAGPRVLEFNCRFGDPETQSIVPRLEGDLLEALVGCATRGLAGVELGVSGRAAVTVVLAAARYPAGGDTGTPIEGVTEAEELGVLVFHAGTGVHDGQLVTNGGRILNVTALAETLADARALAYTAASRISFAGARVRRDIAAGVAAVRA